MILEVFFLFLFFILLQGGNQSFLDLTPQLIRCQHLDIRAVAQDIQHQFAGIAIREAELIGFVI